MCRAGRLGLRDQVLEEDAARRSVQMAVAVVGELVVGPPAVEDLDGRALQDQGRVVGADVEAVERAARRCHQHRIEVEGGHRSGGEPQVGADQCLLQLARGRGDGAEGEAAVGQDAVDRGSPAAGARGLCGRGG